MSSFDQNTKGKAGTSGQLNAQDSNMGPSTSGEVISRNKRTRRENEATLDSSFTSHTITLEESQASSSCTNAYAADAEDPYDDGHSSEYKRRRLEEKREYNRRNAARARLRTKEQISNLIQQVEDLKSKLESMEHQKLELEIQMNDLRKENKRLYELLHQQRPSKNHHQNQMPGMSSWNGGLGNNRSNTVTSDPPFHPSPSAGGEVPSVLPLLHSVVGGGITAGVNPSSSSSVVAMTQQPVSAEPSISEPQLHQHLSENNMAATLALLLQNNPSFVQGLMTSTTPITQQPPSFSIPQPSTISAASPASNAASAAAVLAAILAINQEKAAGRGDM
jgi:hypothetical protein